jgi:hypothetical protein
MVGCVSDGVTHPMGLFDLRLVNERDFLFSVPKNEV